MMPTVPPWDLVAEQIPHIVWVTDAEGSLEYINRRGYDLLGLTPEEMSGWGRLASCTPTTLRMPVIHGRALFGKAPPIRWNTGFAP